MGAGNGDLGVRGFEGVDWVGGGGVEGYDFSADGQIIAVRSLACHRDTVGIDTLTNSALKCMHQQVLQKQSVHWQYPIDPEALQERRALSSVRHCLQIEVVIL